MSQISDHVCNRYLYAMQHTSGTFKETYKTRVLLKGVITNKHGNNFCRFWKQLLNMLMLIAKTVPPPSPLTPNTMLITT